MLSGSGLTSFTLSSFDDFHSLNRIPKVMTVPGVLEPEQDEDSSREFPSPERRIVVSNQLPVRAHRDGETGKWEFEFDRDSLVLQLKDGFSPEVEVLYVGSLNADIDVSDQDRVSQDLLENFRCVPTFLPSEIQNKFYHGLCKHYLWPLFHYMLPLSPTSGDQFNRENWQAYISANKIFADKIMGVINPDDYVWIHDYHLMILPTLLRRRFHRFKVGFFLHIPFPSSEIYRTLPVREEILRALLNSDLIGFQTYDYARHFLSCCSRMLGLDYESKRGYIGLDYYGRTVSIKILPVGIHMGQLEFVLSLPSTSDKIRELSDRFRGKTVLLGVDDMDLFKGISFKLLAMKHLLEQRSDLRRKVVLIQITNPARSSGRAIQDVENEIKAEANEINRKFSEEQYQPIILINGPIPTFEKAAYYAIAECCIVNAVRDGMNLVPYEYTVCRQRNLALNKALWIDESLQPRKSVLIVSEFIGCSPSLSGAIRVNPWNIEAVADAINSALTMKEIEKELRHEKHYKYISSHDVSYWAQSFDQDLKRACRDHYEKRCWGIGFGLGFRVVALGPHFRKLSIDHIVYAYEKAENRLILLDYDGTVMPNGSVDRAPSSQVISVLNRLCSDPKNVVFIVSGRGKDPLAKWFSPVEKLGISAEHGYFTRWSSDEPWETCSLSMNFDWMKIAEPVMALYTEATDGSFVEKKESALVWNHREADPHFGSSQAKDLLDHLENVLANEPVVVKHGQHIVEVKPQGVSKGIAVKSLIYSLERKGVCPDFVLCIGDDRSDEDMFKSISNSIANTPLPAISDVFACTVGQKPSMAKYYLDDTSEVIKLLEGLASSSQPMLHPFEAETVFRKIRETGIDEQLILKPDKKLVQFTVR